MNCCNNTDELFILFKIMFYLNKHGVEDKKLKSVFKDIAI